MQIFRNTNFQFIKIRRLGYIFSAILLSVSVLSIILHGGPKYNIDFTGGTLLHLKFENEIDIQSVRSALSQKGYGDSEIKHYGAGDQVIVRVGVDPTADQELSTILENSIREALPDQSFEVQRVEKVGPKIGHELIYKALMAIFWAMLLILIYIMWRFEFKFSIGAITALIHDVTITLGIFSVFDIEISAPIIAAVLTIVGYSLNDTIVVYDRIRENLKGGRKGESISSVVNYSINETLSRTVVTSTTTLIVVGVLYLMGGEVLRTFALALIIGIIIGTYSSIFVASPIVVDWRSKKA